MTGELITYSIFLLAGLLWWVVQLCWIGVVQIRPLIGTANTPPSSPHVPTIYLCMIIIYCCKNTNTQIQTQAHRLRPLIGTANTPTTSPPASPCAHNLPVWVSSTVVAQSNTIARSVLNIKPKKTLQTLPLVPMCSQSTCLCLFFIHCTKLQKNTFGKFCTNLTQKGGHLYNAAIQTGDDFFAPSEVCQARPWVILHTLGFTPGNSGAIITYITSTCSRQHGKVHYRQMLLCNKLASLKATLVRNYYWVTHWQGWSVELLI